jgi:hypothetical protein
LPPHAPTGLSRHPRALNAIAEYADYKRRYTKRSNQVQRSFEDTRLKQRGMELVVAA